MNVTPLSLEGVLVIEPKVFSDSRGFFIETYQHRRYAEVGIKESFVQDNLSRSVKGVLRGLHYQIRNPQAKLVQVLEGEIFDVVVDLRPGSKTYRQWEGVHLSAEKHRQIFVPTGFAHGFCVLSDTVLFSYKCSELYAPDDEGGILWSDPDIGIDWPVTSPLVSEKDAVLPRLSECAPEQLPQKEVL